MPLQDESLKWSALCSRQTGCQYGSICNGTFRRCESLGNEKNFGGFIAMGNGNADVFKKDLGEAMARQLDRGSEVISNKSMGILSNFLMNKGKMFGYYYSDLLFLCRKEPIGIYGVMQFPNASQAKFFETVKSKSTIDWSRIKTIAEPAFNKTVYNINEFSINGAYGYNGIIVKSLEEAEAIPDFMQLTDPMINELNYKGAMMELGVDTSVEDNGPLTPELWSKLTKEMAKPRPIMSGYMGSYTGELKAAQKLESTLFTLEQAEQILNKKKAERKTKQAIVVREAVKDRQLLY
jgi:hypothetical protein